MNQNRGRGKKSTTIHPTIGTLLMSEKIKLAMERYLDYMKFHFSDEEAQMGGSLSSCCHENI